MNSYKKKFKSVCVLTLLLCTAIIFTGCGESYRYESDGMVYYSGNEVYFNTYVTITIYEGGSDEALKGAFDICKKYDNLLSRTNKDSEIYALNNASAKSEYGLKDYKLSSETAALVSKALKYCEISKGNFDITIAPVTKLWGFSDDSMKLPDKADIDDALAKVNYKWINLDGDKISFEIPGMEIDLGAIAKGYIADKIKEYLIEKGVTSAVLSLGGNVLCIGNKPSDVPFRIGIQKPFSSYAETVAIMNISDLSVVSSGIYEKSFEGDDGKLYHHIINPRNGYPYDNGLIAVTVIGPESATCDALTTTLFSMGQEAGLKYIESLDNYYALFIDNNYSITYSDGFMDNISVEKVEG